MSTDTQQDTRLIRASENAHWYTQDGAPAYEVRAKNGNMRPTTLADARKSSLLPSVTSILQVIAKPGLQAWKDEQLLQSALTLPKLEGEDLHTYAKRIVQDSKEQGRKAAEKGTEIHAMVDEWFKNPASEPLDPDGLKIIGGILDCMKSSGLGDPASTLISEKSFASPLGFGGKVDLHNNEAVIDFKTKANWKKGDKLGYEEHAMQLAAYDVGLSGWEDVPRPPSRRRINIFISTEEPGKVELVEWETGDYWERFALLLEFWQRTNSFGPYAKSDTKTK